MGTQYRGPEGIGGWLILPAFGLVISPIAMILQFWRDILPTLDKDIWAALTTPGSGAYHPMWGTIIVTEVTINLALIAFTLYVAWHFFSRSPKLPGLYTIWLLATLAVQGIDLALIKSSAIEAIQLKPEDYRDLIRSVISAAIWIPYFHVSERVANTFVDRGPARKPMGHSVFDDMESRPAPDVADTAPGAVDPPE